jgi:hypothetical protein
MEAWVNKKLDPMALYRHKWAELLFPIVLCKWEGLLFPMVLFKWAELIFLHPLYKWAELLFPQKNLVQRLFAEEAVELI